MYGLGGIALKDQRPANPPAGTGRGGYPLCQGCMEAHVIFEKIKTPGLSHLSYLVGSSGKAAVIDPRRDCEIYVEKARAEGLEITHILETHRNEDFVSGAPVPGRNDWRHGFPRAEC